MIYIRCVIVFIGALIMQWLWSSYLPLAGLAPQVLLIMTMAVASQAGPIAGQCYGFAWGLMLDVFSTHLFGGNALCFTLAAYFVGMLRRQMDVSTPPSQVMLVLLLTPVYFLTVGLLGLLFEHHFLWVGWKAFLVNPFFNGLVAPIGFGIARRFIDL
jgi:rod shape-determining protein MreD